MILSFKTKINDKPTLFVEKIWQSFSDDFTIDHFDTFDFESNYLFNEDAVDFSGKLHTIREDLKNRWKKGNKIDFFINARQPDMFRFAPVVPVIEIQNIEFLWNKGFVDTVSIYIDGECYVQNYGIEFNSSSQRQERMENLATNDGFDSVEDFLKYFNADFKGKIIHWTNFKY
ncbi:hypothetical protein [Flavobacterium sp. 3-210]